MDQQQLDQLFERHAQQFSDLALSIAFGVRVPMERTPMRALAVSLKEMNGEERDMVSVRLARMVSDLVPFLADAGVDVKEDGMTPQQRFRAERGLSSAAAAQRALDIVESFDYGVRQRRFGRSVKEDSVTLPSLASLNPDETYLLYAGGDDRFRPQNLTLAQGTEIGGNDLSGMTLEEAFNDVIRPAAEAAAAHAGLEDPVAVEEYIYKNGYRPLWSIWVGQNMPAMKDLRSHLNVNVGSSSVSMARVRHLVDSTATSRFSPARVLEDIIDRGPAPFDVQEVKVMFAQPVQLLADSRLEDAGIGEYDIYTVGTAGLPERDFWRLVPSGTEVMVVFTSGRDDAHKQFNFGHLRDIAKTRGVGTVEFPILAADTKAAAMKVRGDARYVDGSVIVMQDGVNYVDYGALAETPDFQKAVEDTVLRHVREGKRVCVVGSGPSAAKGEYGAWRGLLFGQYVETHTPFRVAHIDAGYDGHGLRVYSQEEICRKALPPRTVIENGTTKDIRFLNPATGGKPAKVQLPLGVTLRRRVLPGDDPALRMIDGRLNYGTDVEFRHVEAAPTHVSGKSRFYDSVRENVAQTNFTVVFAAGGLGEDRNVNEVLEMAPARDTHKIMIPETSDACYDPDVADRAARTLSGHLMRSVAFQYARFGSDKVDLDNVKIYVAGSSEARISNQTTGGVTNGDEDNGLPTGYKLELPLGPSQDDVNHFVTEVFRRAFVDRPKTIGVDGEDLPFTIGEIHSHFDSGAGEAGIVAAQHLAYMQRTAGLQPFKPVVISTNTAVTALDGDSPYGKPIDDPAYFRNRAHRGFLPDVVDDMVIEQVRDIDARRATAEDGMQVGLTDRQVMLLYELGIDNGVMIEAIGLAVQEEVSINTERDMVDFLDLLRGNGLDIPADISVDDVAAAYDRALDNEDRWREAGISYITAAGPLYPPSMDTFKEYTETRTRPVVKAGDDGAMHVSSETFEYTVRRPAILWCRGDVSLLQEPSVGILGGESRAVTRDGRVERLSAAHLALSSVPDDLLRAAVERIPRDQAFLAADADAVVAGHDAAKALHSVVTEYGAAIRRVADAHPGTPLLQAMKDARDAATDQEQKILLDDAVRMMEVPVNAADVRRDALKKAVVTDGALRAALTMYDDPAAFTMADAEQLLSSHLYQAMSEYDDVVRRALRAAPHAAVLDTVDRLRDAAAGTDADLVTSNDERSLIREFCSAVAESDLPVVASIDSAVPKDGVFDTLAMRNGRVVAVTGHPFQYKAEDTVQRIHDLGERIVVLNEAVVSVNSVSEESLRAALDLHPDSGDLSLVEAEKVSKDASGARLLFFAMSQYGNDIREAVEAYPTDTVPRAVERLRDDTQAERYLLKSDAGIADVAEEVVRKGGVVVSDKAPASPDAPQRSTSQRLVAGIASVAAVFDQIHHAQPMGLMTMAFYAVAGLTYVTTRPAEQVVRWLRDRHKEREQILESRVKDGRMSLHEAQQEIDADAAATEEVASAVVTVTRDGRNTDASLPVHDAGKMAVDQAYREHEDQMQRRDAAAAEIMAPDGSRRTVYSRIKESLASVFGLDFDRMFRDPKEDRGEDVAEAPQRETRLLSQLEIDVLSYRDKRFFFVPDSQPHIAAAVRERYGDDVKVLDPSLKVKVQEALDLGRVDGQDRFREPEGTQLLPHRSYTYKVYFNDGVVHGVNTLPSGVMGLPPQPERKKASAAWKRFMDSMKDMQRDWLLQAGLPVQAGTAQLRCENADYMVFCPNRIEVRRGDELRCFVEFKDGVIRAGNMAIKDLSEYHETKAYDILPLRRSGRVETVSPEALYPDAPQSKAVDGEEMVSRDVVRGFGDYIREALYDRPVAEQEALKEMQSTREKKEEMDDQIESGHLRIREDNLSIACEDVAKAMQAQHIPDLASFSARDVVAVYAGALRAEEQAKAAVRSCDRQTVKLGKELDAIEKAVESRGMDVEQADKEREDLGNKLEQAYAARRKSLVEIANMEDVKASLREGMYPYGRGGKVVLDGVVFAMRNVQPSEEQMLAAARELREAGVSLDVIDPAEAQGQEQEKDLAPEPERGQERESAGEAVQEIEVQEVVPEAAEAPETVTPQQRLAQLDNEMSEMLAAGSDAMEGEAFHLLVMERDEVMKAVLREAVVPGSDRDGICIVNTPEGQRYCRTEGMDVLSDAYPSLKPMGKTLGCAYATPDCTGSYKLLRRDGSELSPEWFVMIKKTAQPGIFVATTDKDEKYVFNQERGEMTAGPFRSVQDFSEGRARVQRADGRFNFIAEGGDVMQQSMWFDDATFFKNGRAKVRLESPAETTYVILDRDFHYIQSSKVAKDPVHRPAKKPDAKGEGKKPDGGHTPGHPGK